MSTAPRVLPDDRAGDGAGDRAGDTVPWPAEYVERYVAAGYWAGQALGDLLWQVAARHGSDVAVVDGDVRLTYAELTDRADAAAHRLLGRGLVSGDRMVVQLPNCWQFVVLSLACVRSGVVPIMALPAHRRTELAYLARHSDARAIAVPAQLRGFDHQGLAAELAAELPGLRHVLVMGDVVDAGHADLDDVCAPSGDTSDGAVPPHSPDSRDVAVFLLSGGTTGLPKLIARTHDDYAYNARASAEVAGLDASSRYLVALPAGHNFPLACPGILGTLLSGGRVVLLASPEPSRAFATIAAEGITHTAVVPAVAARWLEQVGPDDDLSSLQVLQVGGARLADELARRVRPTLGCALQQVFGMAEGLLNYTRLDDPEDVVCTTQGRPLSPDDEVVLVDEADQPVPAGEAGSLLTRGPYTPRGYFRAAEHNARAFTTDGWYRSGDICRWTSGGNLVVQGRDKDMINRGGEKVSAEEIENFAYRVPGVSAAAAVAMPDQVLGERVCVYVVVTPGAGVTVDDLRAVMDSAGVARFKFPERVVIVDALPTTTVGKIDKAALRRDVAARLGAEQ